LNCPRRVPPEPESCPHPIACAASGCLREPTTAPAPGTYDTARPSHVDELAQHLTLIGFYGEGAPGVPRGLFEAHNRAHFALALVADPSLPIEAINAADRPLVERLRRLKHGDVRMPWDPD
jgi:hypothetical protein